MKQKLITRTITSTDVEILCVNTETAEVSKQNFVVSGAQTDEDVILTEVKAKNPGVVVPVKVLNTFVRSALYGITEEEFLHYATALHDRKSAL